MKRRIPLFLLFIAFSLLTSCDDVEGRLRSRRGGFSAKEKKDINQETTFKKYLNADSLDLRFSYQFEDLMTLTRKAKANDLHDKCHEDFKTKYTAKTLERYHKIVYYFTGAIKNYKLINTQYDYDAASESINCEIKYKTQFQNCEGNTLLALLCYDNKSDLTDLVFNFKDISEIGPINNSINELFTRLNNQEYQKAYETASDRFKNLNYADYFKTLTDAVGPLDLNNLEFTEGIIKIEEESLYVIVELGFSRPNYDGLIINYIVQQNGTLRLDHFEYVPA